MSDGSDESEPGGFGQQPLVAGTKRFRRKLKDAYEAEVRPLPRGCRATRVPCATDGLRESRSRALACGARLRRQHPAHSLHHTVNARPVR